MVFSYSYVSTFLILIISQQQRLENSCPHLGVHYNIILIRIELPIMKFHPYISRLLYNRNLQFPILIRMSSLYKRNTNPIIHQILLFSPSNNKLHPLFIIFPENHSESPSACDRPVPESTAPVSPLWIRIVP